MILLRYLFLAILLVSCSNQATYNYSIESDAPLEDIDTRLVFNIFEKKKTSGNIDTQPSYTVLLLHSLFVNMSMCEFEQNIENVQNSPQILI